MRISVEALVVIVWLSFHFAWSEKGRVFIRKRAFALLRWYTGIGPFKRVDLDNKTLWTATFRDGSRLCQVIDNAACSLLEEYSTGGLASTFQKGRENIMRSTGA